ncbi:ParB/RepB/Spo0J family partition protein [Pseudanabaena sp. PCC 6802]|uniref:ParB/RepB/Spo0J family partition protein n=1 Tax=Pseudanabaena sp. PCC 6802 TaxID=118173 RepID=UPI00034D691B|nr:ParB/RepB/Spo0J family partition protein [Pseudanabaena sp. PCC 6802]
MNRKKEVPFRQIRGKGLDALFGDADSPSPAVVGIDSIQTPDRQPRRYFDPEKLEQLAESIKAHGIIEPLLVRPLDAGRYELVAGERRYRAAKEIGLTEVPITVRDLTDSEALQLALIENLQREDLNPVEETEGILQLLAFRLNFPIADVSSLLYRMNNAIVGNTNHNVMISSESDLVKTCFLELGKMSWESFTRNRLPLLKLPQDVLTCLQQGKLEYTKAKAIAKVKDEAERAALLKAAIEQNLSLKEIRDRIAGLRQVEADSASPSLKARFATTYQRVQKSQIWQDPKKQKQLEKLLLNLEKLCDELP